MNPDNKLKISRLTTCSRRIETTRIGIIVIRIIVRVSLRERDPLYRENYRARKIDMHAHFWKNDRIRRRVQVSTLFRSITLARAS